jgi:hypothetical protein
MSARARADHEIVRAVCAAGSPAPPYGGTPMTCLQTGIQPFIGLSLQNTV